MQPNREHGRESGVSRLVSQLKNNTMSPTKSRFIECDGLDPEAPYSLGNKRYYYERRCNSGHENLTDDEIAFAGGYYDGYNWTVPVCLRCVTDGRIGLHSHNTPVHLVEIGIDDMVSIHVDNMEREMSNNIEASNFG